MIDEAIDEMFAVEEPAIALKSDGAAQPEQPVSVIDRTGRPDPARIDTLCMGFDAAKAAAERAQQALSEAKGELLPVIDVFGYVPDHAPKTTRLEGILYTADATTSSTVEVKEEPVAQLRAELSRLGKPRLFKELFDRQVKHSLRKDAGGTLKIAIGAMDANRQAHLLSIFALCFSVGAKAPSLSVDLSEALKAKEAEKAQKAAAKAAKAAAPKKAKKAGK